MAMKVLKLCVMSGGLFVMGVAHAAPGGGAVNGGNAVEAALRACASQVTKDSGGGPDQTAMQHCMKAKGFTPPDGGPDAPPPGGPGNGQQMSGNGGPPPGGRGGDHHP